MEEPKNVSVNVGETVSLKCRASGDPAPEIIWMQNSLEVPLNDPRYHILADGTLTIESVDADVVGQYECMAKNTMGETKSRPARMAINFPKNLVQRTDDDDDRPRRPKVILKPFDLTVAPSDNIVLHCVATGKSVNII